MWGYTIAAASLGIKHKLVRNFQVEYGSLQSHIPENFHLQSYIFHYTYGIEYTLGGTTNPPSPPFPPLWRYYTPPPPPPPPPLAPPPPPPPPPPPLVVCLLPLLCVCFCRLRPRFPRVLF